MKRFPSTPFATLALVALALVLFASQASAAGLAPVNNATYRCHRSGDWITLKFDLPTRRDYRPGIVYKNGDNRKAALKWENNTWEFTFVNDMQCKDMSVRSRRRVLEYKQCSDGVDRVCYF